MSQRGAPRKRAQPDDTATKPAPRRRRKTDADGDEDGEMDGSHKAKRWEGLSHEQRERLVAEVMRLALFLDHKKHPLKRADITAKVLVEYKGSQLTTQLIAEAQKRFKDIFGYELLEVPKVKVDSSDAGKGTTTGVYILKNAFPQTTRAVLAKDNPGLSNQTVLLHTILAMICLSEGVLESELLFTSLKKLGLDEDRPDPVLGDWKKLIEFYIRELYLHRHKTTRVSTGGASISEFRWGGRALLEVDKVEIMRHVSAMFGETLDPMIVKEMEKAAQQQGQNGVGEEPAGSSQPQTNSVGSAPGTAVKRIARRRGGAP